MAYQMKIDCNRWKLLLTMLIISICYPVSGKGQSKNCESPNVLLLLDKSGSMQGNKWRDAKYAIGTILSGPQTASIRFGLMLFPNPDDCKISSGLDVGFNINNSKLIMDKLNSYNSLTVSGNTPMAAAIAEAFKHFKDPRRNFLLLITDGEESCGGDPAQEVAYLYNNGINTFVLGFGTGDGSQQLEAMAQNGGKARPKKNVADLTPAYYTATDDQELIKAMEVIVKELMKEVCDGLDNDCDGMTDEGDNGLPLEKECTTACGHGVQKCATGQWGECQGAQPVEEDCNGLDDDCDGQTDETEDNGNLIRSCDTACGPGQETCKQGKWADCTAPQPLPESCDNVDENCNGVIDDNAVCKNGGVCLCGECSLPCLMGECPPGFVCSDDFCLTNSCCGIRCSGKFTCIKGECVDSCERQPLQCQDTQEECRKGKCTAKDCFSSDPAFSCKKGEMCVLGQCEADPCLNNACGSDQFCRQGDCVDSCAAVKCGENEKCRDGICSKDSCSPTCGRGFTCQEGVCGKDSCVEIECPVGKICLQGKCIQDICLNITCPLEETCMLGQCLKPEDKYGHFPRIINRPDAGTDIEIDGSMDGGQPEDRVNGIDQTGQPDGGTITTDSNWKVNLQEGGCMCSQVR